MLMFSQGHRNLFHNRTTNRKNKTTKVTDHQKAVRISRQKQVFPLPRMASSLPCYFGPEEEVFALSLEEQKKVVKDPVSWLLKNEEIEEEYISPHPPILMEDDEEMQCDWSSTGCVTPLTLERSFCKPRCLDTPKAKRQDMKTRRGSQNRYVHAYKCEDMMEYAVDVYWWKKSQELTYLPGDWTKLQTDITPRMRATLLAWLVDITRQLEFTLETWCLAVNYLDRFLCHQLLAPDCLQLAGLTSFWLAAKQVELDPPESGELVKLCARAYNTTNFRHMEVIILTKLRFCLAAPTPAFLLSHMVEVGEEVDWSEDLARHLVEITMQDNVLACFPPSKIASCVFTVLKNADSTCLRIFEGACPKCEPHNSDSVRRQFLEASLHRVADLLTC